MIADCPELRLPGVVLTLDSKPPTLSVIGPREVDPPIDWQVTISADEPIGSASMQVIDSYGSVHGVGWLQVNDRTLMLRLPTIGMPTGPLRLVGEVRDLACNATDLLVTTTVRRVRAYDVELGVLHAWEATLTHDHGYEVDTDMGHAFDAEETVDHGYEAEVTFEQPFTVELTLDGS